LRCKYCGSSTSEHEHRCHHCGRWLNGASPVFPIENSAAVLAPEPEPLPLVEEKPKRPARPPRQASLFPSDRPKVIPFESAAGGHIARERVVRARRPSQPATQTNQQSLDFRPRPQRKQAACVEAPIARPQIRLKAACADAGLVAAGVAVAALTFRLMGGSFVMASGAPVFYGVAVAAMALFYHLFWCVLGRETAGMQVFQLRLVTFDGSPPGWRLRVLRLGATCLSIVAAGVGLVWALVDEEKLTWQDHMSKTFPMVHDPNPGTFHRK
jgi:uncharacterized RDD family membrane protein YckC